MKKLLTLVLVMTFVLAMAAPVSAEAPVQITWLHHYQEAPLQQWCEDLVATFEAKNPDVDVVIEYVGSDNYQQTLKTKIAADDAPMLFDLDNQLWVAQYAEAGHLYDVSECDFWKNVSEELNKESIVDGVRYGSTISQCSNNVFYNKTLFKEHGLEVPTTRAEYIALCDKLLELGITPISAAFAEKWCLIEEFKPYFQNYCLRVDSNWQADKVNGNATFVGDENFKKAFTEFVSTKKYWGDDPFGTSYDDACAAVATGKAAMIDNGNWVQSVLMSINPEAEFGTFAIPLEDYGPSYYIMRPGGCQLVYNSKDPAKLDAALRFMEEMFTVEAGTSFSTGATQLSSVNGVDFTFDSCLQEIISAEQSWSIGGLPRWSDEHDNEFCTLIEEYVMEDEPDVEALLVAIDDAFASIM